MFQSAVDFFRTMGETALYKFPLVKLMNTMGIALQVEDNSHGKKEKSWFLGLAPELPRGRVEIVFDDTPDHEV